MMVSKALEIWHMKLKKPDKKGVFSIERLKKSNLLLTKDHDERIGFIVENTLRANSQLSLKNFEIVFHEELINNKSKSYHKNCLLVLADKTVNPEFLIRILVGLMEKSLADKITSKELIGIIKKVSETFDFISNNVQETIGAWGELYFMNTLIQAVKHDKSAQEKIIKSWESVLGRKKIDFRFQNPKTAIEIKTTSKDERIHHISGLDQIKIPVGFQEAYVVSIRIIEDAVSGKTCLELYQTIKNSLKSKELQLEFEERVLVRGSSICKNKNIRFVARDNLSDNFFPFNKIPKPKLPGGILSVSWDVDFNMISPVKKSKASVVLSKIRNPTH
jgi:hypothetical protein